MKIKILVLATFLALTGHLCAPVFAQERTAAQPTFQPTSPVNTTLQMQVTNLTGLVQSLQEEVNKCRLGLAGAKALTISNTSVTNHHPDDSGARKKDDDEAEKEKAEELAACATRSPVPPTSRRGYQAAAEHLGCEDYSHSYFLRHPAMATVCGVDTTTEEQPETVSTTQTISSTALRKSTVSTTALPNAAPAR